MAAGDSAERIFSEVDSIPILVNLCCTQLYSTNWNIKLERTFSRHPMPCYDSSKEYVVPLKALFAEPPVQPGMSICNIRNTVDHVNIGLPCPSSMSSTKCSKSMGSRSMSAMASSKRTTLLPWRGSISCTPVGLADVVRSYED